jgi:hypothetical protein
MEARSACEIASRTLDSHTERLLGIPGCAAVAVGYKEVRGHATDRPAIVVFVGEKRPNPPAAEAVPAEIDGVPTDVVARRFNFALTLTNPHGRFDPLFGGLALAPLAKPDACGTLGCFIRTTGRAAPAIPAGVYFLTNQHVLEAATPPNPPEIVQPDTETPPASAASVCGSYVAGFKDASRDCAIAALRGRGGENRVPNKPWHPGFRQLKGLGEVALGQTVYKFGAASRFTTAQVRYLNFNTAEVRNAIYLHNDNYDPWLDHGDSGSVAVLEGADLVVGLNFTVDLKTPSHYGYRAGLAYPIATQLESFADPGGEVTLAPPSDRGGR